MEDYAAIETNEMLSHAAAWMNLENIMLSWRSWAQKTTYYMILFTQNIQKRRISQDKVDLWLIGPVRDVAANGYGISLRE